MRDSSEGVSAGRIGSSGTRIMALKVGTIVYGIVDIGLLQD